MTDLPAEAIEAAALAQADAMNGGGWYDRVPEATKEPFRRMAGRIIRAALPHLSASRCCRFDWCPIHDSPKPIDAQVSPGYTEGPTP